jgi:hypothetical protein
MARFVVSWGMLTKTANNQVLKEESFRATKKQIFRRRRMVGSEFPVANPEINQYIEIRKVTITHETWTVTGAGHGRAPKILIISVQRRGLEPMIDEENG